MHVQAYKPLDEGEYLALEARSPVRHEYIAGEIFAMTGASIRHNIIAGNLYTALRTHLRGTPCRALMEGVKLYLKKERSYFYPDVMVTCEPRLLELDAQVQVVDSPVLIVEVPLPLHRRHRPPREAARLPHPARPEGIRHGQPGRMPRRTPPPPRRHRLGHHHLRAR